ncbi:hypothetical protein IWX92DRAFT_387305 [Phyllosticta citricarpa]
MAYHQAHLLMLAGYSSFFVSGLVLPKAEYPHPEEDHDVTMIEDDMEVDPSVVPQELNEAPTTTSHVRSAPCSSATNAPPLPSAVNVEKRRKRSLFADQSHVRTISRWLCETQPQGQAAEDRPRQNSMPDISASVRIPPRHAPTWCRKTPLLTGDTLFVQLREFHETKRFCGGHGPRPRLPSIQTTGLKVLAA